jgi:hypothetical protein
MSSKSDLPPSYEEASSTSASKDSPDRVSPAPRNGIPPADRRSMEDEQRPLPSGWVRQYDPESQHQFFVDTNAKPPRSIWHHPYDDETYLSSLPPSEREPIEKLRRTVTMRDIEAESSEEEFEPPSGPPPSDSKRPLSSKPRDGEAAHPELPPRPTSPPQKGLTKFGRKLKDSITNTTHAERQEARRRRAEEERAVYAAHQAFRQALSRAVETGQPQFLGKDADGKEVWVEPPNYGGYGGGYGGGAAYGYNPYMQGPYTNPNAKFIRPNYQYSRPYGPGYGGGLGAPLAAGLLGGALLGGLLF